MTRIPWESKTKVFTSDSAPSAGISWPFQRNVTPAALPTRATISRVARTEVCAGAMRVSWLTGWPSARTEIEEVSVARITSVNVGAADGDAFGVDLGKVRTVTSLLSWLSFSSLLLSSFWSFPAPPAASAGAVLAAPEVAAAAGGFAGARAG